MNPIRRLLFAALLVPAAALADNRPVTVVTDMTQRGRGSPKPAAGHPLYYAPHLRGYQEIGAKVKGEKVPDARAMAHVVAAELAREGYLVADPHHAPDLFLSIAWGRISPSSDVVDQGVNTPDDFGTDGHSGLPDDRVSTLEMAIVLGHTAINLIGLETPGHQQFMEMTQEPRYYIIVSAFDAKSYQSSHRKDLLWTTKISVPTGANYFPELVAGMVKAGGPSFGKETVNHPAVLSIVPEGTVHVGTPTVKE